MDYKRISTVLALTACLLGPAVSVCADQEATQEITILFTHDIHDYFYPAVMQTEKGTIQHGGAARLATLLDNYADDNTIYVDAGDFSMGTLLQAGYADHAVELELLGLLGCSVTTFGNHEFDYGADGISSMLFAAAESETEMPALVSTNLQRSEAKTPEQQNFQAACDAYGVTEYVIRDINGTSVAFLGLMGRNALDDSPTNGQNWDDYIDAAKKTVENLSDSTDLIVVLSHGGTAGDGKTGEDIELAKKVPGIDVIVSGHSHTAYTQPVTVQDTLIVSQGSYLQNLGLLTLRLEKDKPVLTDYQLIPIDETVPEDPQMKQLVESLIDQIDATYTAQYDYQFHDILAECPFDFSSLDHMYATHEEYPMGDLIADSYLYAANQAGIQDIDVALTALGTIRNTFRAGEITVADAFECCSLGVGADGSAGHPIAACYLSGSELKLLAELDASLGPFVNAIKMSYSGLAYTFNEKRMLLDRVTEISLVRPDGTRESIENDKLYKVCCNVYAANMLGMLNGLSKGILSITPKAADGTPVTQFYEYALKDEQGRELKEWRCLADYLTSFEEGKNGLPVVPDSYSTTQGRKVKIAEGGLAMIQNPGVTTLVVLLAPILLLGMIIIPIILIRRRKKRKTS